MVPHCHEKRSMTRFLSGYSPHGYLCLCTMSEYHQVSIFPPWMVADRAPGWVMGVPVGAMDIDPWRLGERERCPRPTTITNNRTVSRKPPAWRGQCPFLFCWCSWSGWSRVTPPLTLTVSMRVTRLASGWRDTSKSSLRRQSLPREVQPAKNFWPVLRILERLLMIQRLTEDRCQEERKKKKSLCWPKPKQRQCQLRKWEHVMRWRYVKPVSMEIQRKKCAKVVNGEVENMLWSQQMNR